MVNTANQHPVDPIPEAVHTLLQNTTAQQQEQVLRDILNEGGMSIDHESLRISGTYAHAARVAEALKAISNNIPTLMGQAMRLIETKQTERDNLIVSNLKSLQAEGLEQLTVSSDKLDKATKNLVNRSGGATNNRSRDLCIALSSALASGILCSLIFSFVLVPQLTKQSKPGDAAFQAWSATDDGRIYYDIFRSGKSTGDACRRVFEKTEGGQIVCKMRYRK
jgi:hypothetical protein